MNVSQNYLEACSMREMKDSGIEWINKIPANWTLKKIKYTLQNRNENNNPIRSRDILSLTAKQGVIPINEKEGGGNKPKEDYSAYKLAYPGDIVMNSMNVLSGSVGLSKYFGCVSPVYYMLRPQNKNDEVRYFSYIFQTTVFQKSLLGLGNGILIKESDNGKLNTIRMRIPLDKLGNLYVPFPNGTVQKKIADYLDCIIPDIDSLVKDIEKQIETLEEYKKSVITETVTKGLTPNTKTKITDNKYWENIPENWELSDIKYLFEIVKRIAGKEGYDILSVTQKGLKIKDISKNEGQIAESYANYQFVYPTDFVMNHMDLLTGWVDCSKYFGVTSPDYRVFRLRDTKNNLNYYKYVMQSCYMNKIFYSLGQGVSNLGRWRLQTSTFNNFKIPVPPLYEQQQIADYLDTKCSEIDTIIQNKKEQLDVLAEYKKSLIYEYVTGKKEVK